MKSPHITFTASGRGKARCQPDPNYPHGMAIDASSPSAPTCFTMIPYPAPECGLWIIECDECPMRLAITAAGRPDDPISVRFPCPAARN